MLLQLERLRRHGELKMCSFLAHHVGLYVHAVRGGDDPAVTDDAASTLVTPRATTMRQAHQPRPRMWHSLGAADDAVEHQRTDIRHSAVTACISTALTMTSQLDMYVTAVSDAIAQLLVTKKYDYRGQICGNSALNLLVDCDVISATG